MQAVGLLLRSSATASASAAATSSTSALIARRTFSPEAARYATIHAFFRRSARDASSALPLQTGTRHRYLHTSTLARDQDKSSDPRREGRQPDEGDKNQTSSSSTTPATDAGAKQTSPQLTRQYAAAFRNWPHSLRELAIKSVRTRQQPSSASSPQTTPSPSQPGVEPHSEHHVAWARPTKEDLLRLARGFWQRARIRFKWFTIRSFRRFNADDISAFFTLGGVSTVLLLILGTTTFVSVFVWALNTLSFDQWIARKIADYLTAETGVIVVFESAIVPKWKDSKIAFKNVYLTKRPQPKEATPQSRYERAKRLLRSSSVRNIARRGTATTAGQGMAWEDTHHDDDDLLLSPGSENGSVVAPINGDDRRLLEEEDDELAGVDTNFTMFDLNVDSIEISLSFSRWWDGKGPLTDATVKGVRGVIDRRNVSWNPDKPYNPKEHRRKPRIGDFHLDHLELEDLLVTVYQPSPPGSAPGAAPFRPFNFSIFRARLPRFRRQWLFYDLLNAEYITGQLDGCLFSLHKPQTIGRSIERDWEIAKEERSGGEARGGEGRPSPWRTMSRFRIDGVNIDHIKSQTGLTGPMSWITSGKFDFVADIRFPREDSDDVDLQVIFAELVDNLSAVVSGGLNANAAAAESHRAIPGQARLSGPAIELPEAQLHNAQGRRATAAGAGEDERVLNAAELGASEGLGLSPTHRGHDPEHYPEELEPEEREELGRHFQSTRPAPAPAVVIDIDIRFKDIKAAVPLFAKDLSYRDNAFVRPIVAFMNANRTLIPIRCRIVHELDEFDGSFDLAQTGLLPIMSAKIHEALAHHVASQNANQQRLRQVSLWTLQMTAHAALTLVKNVRDSFARSTPSPSPAPYSPAAGAPGEAATREGNGQALAGTATA